MRAFVGLILALASAAPATAMQLSSPDLTSGAPMAAAYVYTRCGGQNVSPALSWSGQPAATKSFVVTMIDLDVRPDRWSHWIVVDLPSAVTSIPRGVSADLLGGRGVVSNFGDATYDGPCPPPGTGVHHYEITVWAMPSASEELLPDASARALRAKLAATALDHASLVVTSTGR